MSKSLPAVALIHVPDRFSVVEQGVYRSASPTAAQVPFLASLQLRTIISLTPEFPVRQLIAFTRSAGIDFLHYGTTLWRPQTDWKPISDDIVKATLETVLDQRNHPVLLIDPLGIHQTGCVVGALRMMQGWNFASAMVEYRSHSGLAKHRFADEQYIELFEADLINLPLPQYLPEWYQPERHGENMVAEADMWEDEQEQEGDGEAAGVASVDGDSGVYGEARNLKDVAAHTLGGMLETRGSARDTGSTGVGVG